MSTESNFITEMLTSSPSGIVELYEIDLTPIADFYDIAVQDRHLYFHAGLNGESTPDSVVWQGKTYVPMPIKATGFTAASSGEVPRPSLSISNINLVVGTLVKAYADLVGCDFWRRRTFVKFLDAVNFDTGNPNADPNAHFADDRFRIDRKASETAVSIEFELAPAWDVEGLLLPRRIVTSNLCQWIYRGGTENPPTSGCTYNGNLYFKSDDTPTANPSEDVCGKRLSSCIARFGENNNNLPFGAFPSAGIFGELT